MKTEQAQRLATVLKSARVGLEMSIAQVAEISELPQAVIQDYEDGKREFAYPHELFFLASVLNYPYMKLMEIAGHVKFGRRGERCA